MIRFTRIEGAVESEALESLTVARDQLVLVVGPEHPWANGGAPTPNDLPDSDWVLREPGSGTRSVFEQAVAAFGIDPRRLRIAMELPSNEAVRAAVEAGLGATALSASVAAAGIENGLLRHVPFRLPERDFHVLRRRQHPSRVADALLALLAKV